MADKDPSDVPPIPTPPAAGAAPDDKTVVRPRKKAEPKVVPPAAAVPPVEAAPAVPAAPPAPEPPVNPYAAAPAAPAAPAQPNPYAAPGAPQPYAYGPYVPQPPKGLSITSMVLGIVGVLLSFCYGSGLLLGIGAVVTGHLATKRQPYAKGFWLTGIITGYATIAIGLLWIIGVVLFFVVAGTGSYYSNF